MPDPVAFPFDPDPTEVRPPDSQVPRYWRPRVLARHLGLSRQTVYTLIRRGDLYAITIAGALRVPEASVLAYIERCSRRPA